VSGSTRRQARWYADRVVRVPEHVLRAVDERLALNAIRVGRSARRREVERLVDEQRESVRVAPPSRAEPLYHVTTYGRLAGIVREGLAPNRPRAIGLSAYDRHARGRVFFTEIGGVTFWLKRADAFRAGDDEGSTPVVLRVDPECFRGHRLHLDHMGSNDGGDAWMVQGATIPPECLYVFANDRWVRVDDWGSFTPDFDATLRHFERFAPVESEEW
jgi:hypothetical protein